MSHYQTSLVLEANPAAVYAALTTPEGLRGWWTHDCDVATAGSRSTASGYHKDMRIERLEPGPKLALHGCAHRRRGPQAQGGMGGHAASFPLKADGEGGTRLDFEHRGLVPALECYRLCSNGWRHYLGSLQQFVDTGRGTPYELAAAAATCNQYEERT